MAQKIYMNYKQALNSNDFNRWKLGILEPGRYRGFDTISPSGLSFSILHNVTGIEITEENLSLSPKTGILLTRQGFVIQEDASIAGLVAATNGSNPDPRIDWVICEHEDVNTIGGQAATYAILQGGPLSAPPVLSSPEKQIVVGVLTIPGSAVTLAGATWVPSSAPLLGGQNIFTNFPELDNKYAKLASANAHTAQIQEQMNTTTITLTGNKWIPDNSANTYTGGSAGALLINEIENVRIGLKLVLRARTNNITLGLNVAPVSGGLTIRCPGLEAMGLTTLVMNDGDTVILENFNFTRWQVIAAVDKLGRELKITNDRVTVTESDIATLQGDVSSLQASNAKFVGEYSADGAFNINGGAPYTTGNWVDITSATITTPNDAISRTCLVLFKLKVVGSGGTNDDQVDFRLTDTTGSTVHDETQYRFNGNTATDLVGSTVMMYKVLSLPANTIIKARAKHGVGDTSVSFVKLTVIELYR